MPVAIYPDVGYAAWRAERSYSGARHVMLGAYTARARVRGVGIRRWSGELEVPLRGRLDATSRVAVDRWVQACTDGRWTALVPFPKQAVLAVDPGDYLHIRPRRVRPPGQDADGVPYGAIVEWTQTAPVLTAPDAPVDVAGAPTLDADDAVVAGSVTLTWSVDDNGGLPLTLQQYRVQPSDSDWGDWVDVAADAVSVDVTELEAGDYLFEVRAANFLGLSDASVSESVTVA